MKAPFTVCLAADRKTIVKYGDPRAVAILFPRGAEIPDADAIRYGLIAKPEVEPEATEAAETPAKPSRLVITPAVAPAATPATPPDPAT